MWNQIKSTPLSSLFCCMWPYIYEVQENPFGQQPLSFVSRYGFQMVLHHSNICCNVHSSSITYLQDYCLFCSCEQVIKNVSTPWFVISTAVHIGGSMSCRLSRFDPTYRESCTTDCQVNNFSFVRLLNLGKLLLI